MFVSKCDTKSYQFQDGTVSEPAYNVGMVRLRLVWMQIHRTPRGAIMAKKKPGASKVPVTKQKEVIRHARVELPDGDYMAVKKVARANGLSVAAYIRMAILQRVRSDRAEAEGGEK
jgi:hypothetical protein